MSRKLEREVLVTPAYDKRDNGKGACLIYFYLKGSKGAVQFQICTDWYLPHNQREDRDWWAKYNAKFDTIQPQGWDVGYHSLEPQHEDQTSMNCTVVPGGKCYYGGSSWMADEWVKGFLEGGTEWLWPKLEEYYRSTFGED